MGTRKGVIITVVILVAITIASFSIWSIPQNNQMSFVVTDFKGHLDGIKNIHKTISDDIEQEFMNLVDGKISPEEYIQIADVASTQIKSQIIQLVESKAEDKWQDSYLKYLESLRKFNSYISETIIYANMVKDGKSPEELENSSKNIQILKSEYQDLIKASDEARPKN